MGVHERGFPGEEPYLTSRYAVVRVWQFAPEPLLSGGLALLPLAPISAVPEAELPGIIKRMLARVAPPTGDEPTEQAPAVAVSRLPLRFDRVQKRLRQHAEGGLRGSQEPTGPLLAEPLFVTVTGHSCCGAPGDCYGRCGIDASHTAHGGL